MKTRYMTVDIVNKVAIIIDRVTRSYEVNALGETLGIVDTFEDARAMALAYEWGF